MGTRERREFYTQATHILFAIILAHSFMLASDTMIPIGIMFEPDNHATAATFVFSYILIVSSWIGYSRSTSIRPYKDTGWGIARFVFDILILFEYFYLLQIIKTEHIHSFAVVVVVIFFTYMLSDSIKILEHSTRVRVRIKRRSKATTRLFVLGSLVALAYYLGWYAEIAVDVGISAHVLTVIMFTILVIVYRRAKWNLKQRRSF